MKSSLDTIKELDLQASGMGPGKHINDTSAYEGKWIYMHVIADAEIASMLEAGIDIPEMAGVTLTSGFVYYGPITSITLTSGHVKMFNEIVK